MHSHKRLFAAGIQQMKPRGQAIGDGARLDEEEKISRDHIDALFD